MELKKICIISIIFVFTLVFGVAAIYVINNLKDTTKPEMHISKIPASEITVSESSLASHQGNASTDLMPYDLTFTKLDVPDLIDHLNSSNYKAVYLDDEMYICVTNDNSVHISNDSGTTWKEYNAENIASEDFAKWLLENDPIPGYSMKEMQNRLEKGLEVKHMVFEGGKEMYIVIDENDAQIELVQPKKLASVLLDGQRMMVTSEQIPMRISKRRLELFYDLLVSNNILTNTLAEQDYFERISYIEENNSIFILTD